MNTSQLEQAHALLKLRNQYRVAATELRNGWRAASTPSLVIERYGSEFRTVIEHHHATYMKIADVLAAAADKIERRLQAYGVTFPERPPAPPSAEPRVEWKPSALRAALEPFAEFERVMQHNDRVQMPDNRELLVQDGEASGVITRVHFRQARAVWEGTAEDERGTP